MFMQLFSCSCNYFQVYEIILKVLSLSINLCNYPPVYTTILNFCNSLFVHATILRFIQLSSCPFDYPHFISLSLFLLTSIFDSRLCNTTYFLVTIVSKGLYSHSCSYILVQITMLNFMQPPSCSHDYYLIL